MTDLCDCCVNSVGLVFTLANSFSTIHLQCSYLSGPITLHAGAILANSRGQSVDGGLYYNLPHEAESFHTSIVKPCPEIKVFGQVLNWHHKPQGIRRFATFFASSAYRHSALASCI
jgi:hypothetical protein